MSRFCFCNCPAGFSAEPERHAPDCPGRSGAGKARTPVPATLTASQPVESGVDFGIDGRSVRVSQEAYSIFLAREAAEREKIAALQQRLTAADDRADQLTQQLAIESAIKEPAGEDVLWQVLDAAVGVLTRRAAPHAWESEAHQAGLKIILARRAGLAATALKPADGRGAEVMSFAQIAQFNDDNDHCPERDE